MWQSIKHFFSSHSRLLILLGLIIFVVSSIATFEILTPGKLAQQKRVGEALLPFALGLGALLSGTAGFVYLEGWLGKQKKTVNWKKKFPIDKLDIDFKVVQSERLPGTIYIHDLKNSTKHWIVNPETLRALELSYDDVNTLTVAQFEKLSRGDNIKIAE